LPTPGTTGKELTRFYVEYEMERLARPVDPQQEDKPTAEWDPSFFTSPRQDHPTGHPDSKSSEGMVAESSARRRVPNILRK